MEVLAESLPASSHVGLRSTRLVVPWIGSVLPGQVLLPPQRSGSLSAALNVLPDVV